MTLKDIPIEDATADDLRYFCTQIQNLDISPRANRPQMRQALAQAGWTGDTIKVLDKEAQVQTIQPASMDSDAADAADISTTDSSDGAASRPKYAEITIPTGEGKGGQRPIFVAVNLKGMLVPRGEKVRIPYAYYEALLNAEKTIYEKGPDDLGIGTPRSTARYPMTLHGFHDAPTARVSQRTEEQTAQEQLRIMKQRMAELERMLGAA